MSDAEHTAEIEAKAAALNAALRAASRAGLTVVLAVSDRETLPPCTEVNVLKVQRQTLPHHA